MRLEDLFIWDKTTSTKHNVYWMELEEENLNSLHFHWGMEMNSLDHGKPEYKSRCPDLGQRGNVSSLL